jgi:hypothetical protein
MTVTTATPDHSEYQRAARAMRAPLAQSKLIVKPVNRAATAVDDEIQRRVDKTIGELEEL